ncbi:MAG TPA: hypothetical protein V6C97_34695 [Oculatellaceae cyanobacterium]
MNKKTSSNPSAAAKTTLHLVPPLMVATTGKHMAASKRCMHERSAPYLVPYAYAPHI